MFNILSLIANSVSSPFEAHTSLQTLPDVRNYMFMHDTAINGFIFHRGDSFAYSMSAYNDMLINPDHINTQSIEWAVITDSTLCEQESLTQAQIIGNNTISFHLPLFG